MTCVRSNPLYFEARTEKVLAPSLFRASLSLGFGVQVCKRINFQIAEPVKSDLWDKAIHCLVVLIGGKKILVQLDESEVAVDDSPSVRARVFLKEHRGSSAVREEIDGVSYVDIGKCVDLLAGASFPTEQINELCFPNRRRGVEP